MLKETEMAKNKTQLSSHNFENVYEWLGINLNTLGCIMLDLRPLKLNYLDFVGTYYLHRSSNEERFWINGWIFGSDTPHITLLYGLLKSGRDYSIHVEEVLSGWKINNVEIEDIGYFESPYTDEPYYCIVAHIKVTPQLLEGHQRLEFLPHINTFAGYKPHMTIAYIEKDSKVRDIMIQKLKKKLIGKKLKINSSINLGGK